jgi:DNA-binding NtrC family response regulator
MGAPRILFYHHDAPLRQAYAAYLTHHGLTTHSCGTPSQLFRLLLWHPYEVLLADIDTALQFPTPFLNTLQRYLPETTVVGTSGRSPMEVARLAVQLELSWFMLEPLSPQRVRGMISIIKTEHSPPPQIPRYPLLRQRLEPAR